MIDKRLIKLWRQTSCNRMRQARRSRGVSTQARHLSDILAAYGGCCPFCGDDEPATVRFVDRNKDVDLSPGMLIPCCDYCSSEMPPVDIITLYHRRHIDQQALETIVSASIVIEPEMRSYWKNQLKGYQWNS